MRPTKGLLAALAIAMIGTSASAQNVMRWGGARDIYSLDPYSYGDSYTIAFLNHVYEGLVRYNDKLEIEPALAESWEIVSPSVWRFTLRDGVKFHDGADLTSDDVLASLTRVSDETSPLKGNLPTYKSATKIDDRRFEIELTGAYPLLLNDLTNIHIFDEGWLTENDSLLPTDVSAQKEGFATFNANGTGPFRVESRVPDSRTVLTRNVEWWDTPHHNIDRIEFTPITSAATRVAAMLSGEIDFTEEAPVQDLPRLAAAPGIEVMERANLRTVMLGFNRKDKLTDGRDNPFNELRVRQAFELALDKDLIQRRVMRGKSRNAGTIVSPEIPGYSEAMDAFPAADPAKAQALLAEAGHEGLPFTLTCTTDSYVNEEELCNAMVSMLARAGFRPTLDIGPAAVQTPKRSGGQADVYLIGWANEPMLDSYSILVQMIETKSGTAGVFNWGGWSYPEIDALIQQASTEMDRDKRLALQTEALGKVKDELVMLPLHQQPMAWAMSDKIESTVQLADNKVRHWLTMMK
ncbi:MAG: ABC transporter substrate-binding protein [Paracoccus sp. (in: a-proteobacteria)]|uniref:ABC transporter substrate-binding protein n=1 Tax=Paracoccus sp. TaxID=267 RepID=UPI0026E08076|nr:ABC transporter substrate-binding protein [Paracoccus sp. (in: a-proteobacteria)]MDO5632362.1 ABC transporter substrate-binding protein [Paracoccus sp. (in: a-proteobacteria)]